jgi:gamma-glutamyltranspeptidase / glutathione hydrolase
MKPMSFDFASRRSMVIATRGMVAAENPLAAEAGLAVLRRGGNAADAAIATAAAMNVTSPAATGIGGDCFALYYDAKTKTVTALNGSGRAPASLTIDHLNKQGITSEIPARSPHAVTVPGAARGWEDLLKRHGTMTLADVLQDAIYYAEHGAPVSPIWGAAWGGALIEKLLKSNPHTEEYLPGGTVPKVGQIVQLPGLARTLRAVAEGGADAFYKGPTAHAIVKTLQTAGSLLAHDDLEKHESTWDDAIATDYRGVTVLEHPPNGQGLAALIAMNIASGWNLAEYPHDSPERMHLMIEAMRLAFADARQYIADPAVSPVPVAGLLDANYAAQRRALVRMEHAMQPPSYGKPPKHSDTTYLCVIDGEGNGCSFINSLYMGFGSGIVAEGTGVFLQNRGANFVLDANHPNALQGGKRPYHTIIPGMLLKEGNLWGTFGVMGGFMQPQGHFQVVSAMVDDALNPQDALDRPRWCLDAGTGDSILLLEEGVPLKTMSALAAKGHRVAPVSGRDRGGFGSGQIILRDEAGALYGGSDPRKDGCAIGF